MGSERVSPLRISKTTPMSSPAKASGQRPLSEISASSQRRNSPSFNQVTKKMIGNRESSPFEASPFTNSPRLFWKQRDPISPNTSRLDNNENSFSFDRESSLTLSPKRGSIENLKKASRVKNSSMFAREQKNEYDPAAVSQIERPLASGRPLSTQVQGNAFGGRGLDGMRKENEQFKRHSRTESQSKIPLYSPTKSSGRLPTTEYTTSSPITKEVISPKKSSLINGRASAAARAYEPESSMMSDEDDSSKHTVTRPLRRHAKSVTFEAAPPQINEYEMVTPEPSSVASGSREGSYDSFGEFDDEGSFERGSSIEQDDSFDESLEDTEKTPVVLPEDWRHMSPELANTSLADTFDDPFDGPESSPVPSARPTAHAQSPGRNGSANSESSRPLPALPGMHDGSFTGRSRRESNIGLATTLERANSIQRSLPSPPRPASVSKADILSMRDTSMSLEERLKLMELRNSPDREGSRVSLNEDSPQKTPRNGSTLKIEQTTVTIEEKDDTLGELEEGDLPDFAAPRISRESILRKVKSQNFDNVDFEYEETHESMEADYSYGDLDPDVPIPSRETSSNFDEHVGNMHSKTEGEEIDHYSIPDMYSPERSLSRLDDYDRETSVIRYGPDGAVVHDEDDTSIYSASSKNVAEQKSQSDSAPEDEGPPTPKAQDFEREASENSPVQKETALPDFSAFSDADFDLQLRGFMKGDSPAAKKLSLADAPRLDAQPEFLQRPATPEEQKVSVEDTTTDEEPGTPESVIHRSQDLESSASSESLVVPEPVATIKAPGSKLKTRPSITPADAASMAAARRQVSGELPPPIPARSPRRSMGPDEVRKIAPEFEEDGDEEEGLSRLDSFRKMKLDVPLASPEEDLSFNMDMEFDRVVEAQKKGYLMRQNTKIVVATNRQFSDESMPKSPTAEVRGTKSAGSSPRKASHERSKTWTTEPWNGKVKRKSLRSASGGKRPPSSGAVPPLPGQESNVNSAGLGTLIEDQQDADFSDEESERGRLFVKVVGVKDLDLPLPKHEPTQFQLTLDNGLHCVTTSWLELGRSAPIGQEFELVVMNDLEFQLTLQTKLQPPPKEQAPPLPIKSSPQKKSGSAFSRLLASPKKRKEQERRLQEEQERAAQQLQQEQAARRRQQPSAWDLLHDLVAPDGSFARAYVCLKNHERQAFGRPLTVDIPCFNEWAVEDAAVASSARSKHGGVVRRPPYRVGKLTLQLLYVPKPKNATDDDMPKSMNACIRELKEAEEIKSRTWEGHLSQQGGDCPFWRRRFFRLDGTKLTAYHETTRQPRATINLAKATKLIDDRSKLTQSTQTKSGGRRKSAFSEEEEGYMFVEEGFRIRFANGEVIDFYADSAEQKEGWMKVLVDAVGKESTSSARAWTATVLDKERQEQQKAQALASPTVPYGPAAQLQKAQAIKEATAQNEQRRPSSADKAVHSSKSVPSSPQKRFTAPQHSTAPPPPEKDVEHLPQARTNAARRAQVKSMIF